MSSVATGCDLTNKCFALGCVLCQDLAAFTAVKGTGKIALSAAFIIELLSSVISFSAQLLLFPDKILWTSVLGSALISSSVVLQVFILNCQTREQ